MSATATVTLQSLTGSLTFMRSNPLKRIFYIPCRVERSFLSRHTWPRDSGLRQEAEPNGETSAATLHYCDWIRGWNDPCLRIYGEIGLVNPSFLDRFGEN